MLMMWIWWIVSFLINSKFIVAIIVELVEILWDGTGPMQIFYYYLINLVFSKVIVDSVYLFYPNPLPIEHI